MNEDKLNKIKRNGIILIITGSILGVIILFFSLVFIVIKEIVAFLSLAILFCVTALPLYSIGIKYRKHPELYYNHPIGTIRRVRKNFEDVVIDKSEYHYDSACRKYCEQYNKKKEDLNDQDKVIIWECAGNHIAIFLTWLIEHDFFIGEAGENIDDVIREVKERKITGREFLADYLDETLVRYELSDKVYGFIEDYYNDQYFKQYSCFIEKNLNKSVYGTVFSWKDYDMVKNIIEEAYDNFRDKYVPA